MSTGAALAVVTVALVLVVAGLFRLVAVLDSVELGLRRLVAEVRATRKAVVAGGERAGATDHDVASARAALDRLEELKGGRPPSAN